MLRLVDKFFMGSKVRKITETDNFLLFLIEEVVPKWKLLCIFAIDKRLLIIMTETKVTLVERLARRLATASQHTEKPLTEQQTNQLLSKMLGALTAEEQQIVTTAGDIAMKEIIYRDSS